MTMPTNTPGGLRAILEKVSNRYATSVDKADLLSIDQAIAAINALMPEAYGADGVPNYDEPVLTILDTIKRNFKGEK